MDCASLASLLYIFSQVIDSDVKVSVREQCTVLSHLKKKKKRNVNKSDCESAQKHLFFFFFTEVLKRFIPKPTLCSGIYQLLLIDLC